MYKLHSLQHPDWYRTGTSYCYFYIFEIIHHDIVLFFRKPTRPSLPLKKETFESFRLPLAKGRVFRKPTRPSLPLKKEFFLPLRLSCKESSTFSPSPSQWSLHPLRFPRSRGTETSGSGDVTALRCSEPLRYKVGGASKPSPCFAGWDRMGTVCLLPSKDSTSLREGTT